MTAVLDEPRLVADSPDAKPLVVELGDIRFSSLNFWYTDGNTKTQVFDAVSYTHLEIQGVR